MNTNTNTPAIIRAHALEYLEHTAHGMHAYNLFGNEVKISDITHIESILLTEPIGADDLGALRTVWGAQASWIGDLDGEEPGLYSLIQDSSRALGFRFICGIEALQKITQGLA